MLMETKEKKPINGSEAAAGVFRALLDARNEADRHREMFYVMVLDSQNRILGVDLIGIGTINQCVPYSREAYRLAVIKDAAGIIVCHNHPSGGIEPSDPDRRFTKTLKRAGDLLGVRFLDHVIIGDEGFYSFCDNGQLNDVASFM